MNIRQFEELIKDELRKVVEVIITNNLNLNISARARAGAEISDFLEDKFVTLTQKHNYFCDSEPSPKGATKNPWDVRTKFKYNNLDEEIWIDFKALKTSSKDSNPDIGTPNKIIKFIKSGNFYLVYIFVYYEETKTGLKFVKNNKSYTKIYFLKDIHHSFRRNPKNQLQVNMSELPEYRNREEFIKILTIKLRESHKRQIDISSRTLKKLDDIENELLNCNKVSETKISKNI